MRRPKFSGKITSDYHMSITIKTVQAGGLGAYLGLQPGDKLLKINGRKVIDHLDYQFRIADSRPILEVESGGVREAVEVDKEEATDLGVTFEDMPIRKCANDCLFCFVDQNPAGMRESLYFRDGDYRLSFLYGHYITLTNMGRNELKRIVEQAMSPLYISVHATDPELRKTLLLYRKDDDLLEKLRYLTSNGIELHSQVVLCPGINDGEQLRRTLGDLMTFMPQLKSVALVPVGLTGHRLGLAEIPPVTPAYAENFLEEYAQLDAQFRHSNGGRFVLPSDEWYILAGETLPPMSFYEGLEMEENGVGQVRQFLTKLEADTRQFPSTLPQPAHITLATGVLASGIFERHVVPALESIEGLTATLQTVPNQLLGAPVTVAGLLSGGDFISHLEGRNLGQSVWATDRILNEDKITLDDMTLEQISAQLGVPFRVTGDSLAGLVAEVARG